MHKCLNVTRSQRAPRERRLGVYRLSPIEIDRDKRDRRETRTLLFLAKQMQTRSPDDSRSRDVLLVHSFLRVRVRVRVRVCACDGGKGGGEGGGGEGAVPSTTGSLEIFGIPAVSVSAENKRNTGRRGPPDGPPQVYGTGGKRIDMTYS